MKTFLLSLTIFTYTIVSCQDIPESKVPSVVINTLKARFANAKGVEWEKKGDGYEAEFVVNNVDHKAFLDASGNLVMHKQRIASSDLPAAVVNTIRAEYSDSHIDDVGKIETEQKIFYQVELEGSARDQKLVNNADGKVDKVQHYW